LIDDQELPRFVERWMPPSLPHRSRPDASKSNACKSTCGGVTVDHELPEFVERRHENPPQRIVFAFVGCTIEVQRYQPYEAW
jgi:hypothetical protein